jgi:uridine kinase
MTAAEVASEITRDIVVRLAEESARAGVSKPVVVMVTGPPATGKTALCAEIAGRLGIDRVATLVDDREIYSRAVRERLGVTGIDHAARDMDRLKRDLISLREGKSVPDRSYERYPDRAPRLVSCGTLAPKAVILLDGFAWCYQDFDGLWDLKYVLLPRSFEQSARMSSGRDTAERHYSDQQADTKHRVTYEAYARHGQTLRRDADRIYRVSADYRFEVEQESRTGSAPPTARLADAGRHGDNR